MNLLTKICCCFLFCSMVDGRELKFPPGFKLGTATSSYQIEGGWNASGKKESIWDKLTHTHPDLIADQSNGDTACDSYNLWEEDVRILKDLNVDFYRFSLSWTRLLPDAFPNYINPDGVRYYNNLIDALILNGIEPMVTIYHWDLPQRLQEIGGWTNPLLALYFEDYARVAFELFGDRVKSWITFNEPDKICRSSYEIDSLAPAYQKTPGIGLYLCGKTVLLAHGKAYRVYDEKYREKQGGKIGITIDAYWAEPGSSKTEDIEAAERDMQFQLGWWAHPIFSKQGDYPEIMKSRIAMNSKWEKFPRSRLPPITREEVQLIQGSFDFLGLNHYFSVMVSNGEYPSESPESYMKDKDVICSPYIGWKCKSKTLPLGLRKLLTWIREEYNNPLVIITENGCGSDEGLQDEARVLYLKEYMRAVLMATIVDGCNVNGYTAWSLMDNMEWRYGYTLKFGIFDVNFTDPLKARTPKMSAEYYKEVIRTRALPEI